MEDEEKESGGRAEDLDPPPWGVLPQEKGGLTGKKIDFFLVRPPPAGGGLTGKKSIFSW